MERKGLWVVLLVMFLVLAGLSLWFDCKLQQVQKERRDLERVIDKMAPSGPVLKP